MLITDTDIRNVFLSEINSLIKETCDASHTEYTEYVCINVVT
jgi:hypothetical protein